MAIMEKPKGIIDSGSQAGTEAKAITPEFHSSIRNLINANIECLQSWREINKVCVPFWILITKPMSKLIQLLRKDRIND